MNMMLNVKGTNALEMVFNKLICPECIKKFTDYDSNLPIEEDDFDERYDY